MYKKIRKPGGQISGWNPQTEVCEIGIPYKMGIPYIKGKTFKRPSLNKGCLYDFGRNFLVADTDVNDCTECGILFRHITHSDADAQHG